MVFTCALCGKLFESEWDTLDAVKEFEAKYGRAPTVEEMETPVCDPCYRVVTAGNGSSTGHVLILAQEDVPGHYPSTESPFDFPDASSAFGCAP